TPDAASELATFRNRSKMLRFMLAEAAPLTTQVLDQVARARDLDAQPVPSRRRFELSHDVAFPVVVSLLTQIASTTDAGHRAERIAVAVDLMAGDDLAFATSFLTNRKIAQQLAFLMQTVKAFDTELRSAAPLTARVADLVSRDVRDPPGPGLP